MQYSCARSKNSPCLATSYSQEKCIRSAVVAIRKSLRNARDVICNRSICSTADIFNRPYTGKTALRLSVELRLLKVSKLLIEKGATIISSAESLDIESENVHDIHARDFVYLILPAIKNDDADMTSLIVKLMKASKQYLSCSDCMCTALNTVCDRTSTDSEFSPLQVAYLHCVLLSTCEVYEYLVAETGPSCVLNLDSNTVSLVLKHATPVCPGLQFTSPSSHHKKVYNIIFTVNNTLTCFSFLFESVQHFNLLIFMRFESFYII